MANVRFYSGTKAQYLSLASHNPLALYFCDDTGELFKGDVLISDGIRVVSTRADLPTLDCAADGIVYYVHDSRNGYMVSPDRTEWLQTIYAPVTDAYVVPESEIYNTVTTVGAVRDIEKKIYERIDEVTGSGLSNLTAVDGTINIVDADHGGKNISVAIATDTNNALCAVDGGLFVPTQTAGSGIEISDNKISVKIASASNGLVAVDGALTINLATRKSHGAMSKEDKAVIDSIPYVYESRKYDVSGTPIGTLIDYRDHEIRIMCPADTKFTKQNVGSTGNPNMYYMTFKAYAPNDAVSFKEGDRGVINDEMFTFNGPASGIDEFGRKYSVCWLALAMYDSTTDTWTYFGKNSNETKYVGWDYVVEWYDAEQHRIGFDSIRINLSNESCHYNTKPYYLNELITSEEVENIQITIAAMEESYSWGEM